MRPERYCRSSWFAACCMPAVLLAAIALPRGGAVAAEVVTAQGIGEGPSVRTGRPPVRADLSPAQRRLMARRAAEIGAVRNAVFRSLGVCEPGQVGTGRVEVRGEISGFRVLESRELPDGCWRAVVEVTLPAAPAGRRVQPISVILTDYLQFRSGLLWSRCKRVRHQDRLARELEAAEKAVREMVAEELRNCRADLVVIDRALADLETKTVGRLSAPGAASAPTTTSVPTM